MAVSKEQLGLHGVTTAFNDSTAVDSFMSDKSYKIETFGVFIDSIIGTLKSYIANDTVKTDSVSDNDTDEGTNNANMEDDKTVYNIFVDAKAKYGTKTLTDRLDALDTDDKILLKLYARWYITANAHNSGIQGMSINKEVLRERNIAETDWEYAGYLDLGPQYNSLGDKKMSCALCATTKALRNVYTAYSPSTKSVITLGCNCTCNLFRIDSSVLANYMEITQAIRLELIELMLCWDKYDKSVQYNGLMGILYNMQNNPKLAALCLKFMGKTVFELFSNFIARGIHIPNKLLNTVLSGYTLAVKEYMQTSLLSHPYSIVTQMKVKENLWELNKSLVHANTQEYADSTARIGSFYYPLSCENPISVMQTLCCEEIAKPTVLSCLFNISEELQNLQKLSATRGTVFECTRTQFLLYLYLGQEYKDTNIIVPFNTVSELFAWSFVTGEFWYLQLFLGMIQADNYCSIKEGLSGFDTVTFDWDTINNFKQSNSFTFAEDYKEVAWVNFKISWRKEVQKLDAFYGFSAENLKQRTLLLLLYLQNTKAIAEEIDRFITGDKKGIIEKLNTDIPELLNSYKGVSDDVFAELTR